MTTPRRSTYNTTYARTVTHATESWWAAGLSRDAFDAKVRDESHRMRWSAGSNWVSGAANMPVTTGLGAMVPPSPRRRP